jgi:hypothetical protein
MYIVHVIFIICSISILKYSKLEMDRFKEGLAYYSDLGASKMV